MINSEPFKYYSKIDSLRGFAVGLVVIGHWVPKLSQKIPLGAIGVDIFFVISGFLITSILIRDRLGNRETLKDKGRVLKVFFIKRILRIFPLYYLTLFLFWNLESEGGYNLKENIVFYLTYTVNFLFYFKQSWDGYISPLWSLSVEEQFYLFWPFLVLFLPKSSLGFLLTASIIVGIGFEFFGDSYYCRILTPACMSALGLGGLLAWIVILHSQKIKQYQKFYLIVLIPALIISGFSLLVFDFAHNNLILRIGVSLFSVHAIIYALGLFKTQPVMEIFFSNSALQHLGKISYGIYLFHNLSPIVWKSFFDPYLLQYLPVYEDFPSWFILIFKLGLLYLVAYLSYTFFEGPILKLKRLVSVRPKISQSSVFSGKK